MRIKARGSGTDVGVMQRGAEQQRLSCFWESRFYWRFCFCSGARATGERHCWGHRGRRSMRRCAMRRRAIHRFMRAAQTPSVSVTDDPGGELPNRIHTGTSRKDVAVYVGGQTLAPVRISHSAQVLSPAWTLNAAPARGDATGIGDCTPILRMRRGAG